MPGPTNRKKKQRKKINASTTGAGAKEGTQESTKDVSPNGPVHQVSKLEAEQLTTMSVPSEMNTCIESRWNGPRVLDVAAFITSRHASLPSMEDPNCAIYATPEVRDMIIKVLPEENGLVLWYNKSRKSARICPACRRFYNVGDILLPHLMDDQSGSRAEYVDPRNAREKRISGLCSMMCFGIASYSWPGSIGAWGKYTSEIDGPTQLALAGQGANIADDGMGASMKLSRREDMLNVVSEVYRAGFKLY